MNILAMIRARRRASHWWAWLLVAMVAAQSIGFMHTIVHAAPAHGERQVCPFHADAQERAIATGWVAQLFAAHGDESDCRLYDQLSGGDSMPAVPLLFAPLQELPGFVQAFAAPRPPMPAVLVQARGPPSIR